MTKRESSEIYEVAAETEIFLKLLEDAKEATKSIYSMCQKAKEKLYTTSWAKMQLKSSKDCMTNALTNFRKTKRKSGI